MSATICPTITTSSKIEYDTYIKDVLGFATRIHIDISDGEFSPTPLIGIDQVWWPANVVANLHVMYRQPLDHGHEILALAPQLVIFHSEAEGHFSDFADWLHGHGMEFGLALLPDTPAEAIRSSLDFVDHVLIFGGKLGAWGGHADLSLLPKAQQLHTMKPSLEIAWDGGINDQNIPSLIEGGIEVLNVGSYIASSSEPADAYAKLKTLTGS